MTPEADFVRFVGGAIFHALTHLLTHETYHGIRGKVSERRLLRNQDVLIAVRRSAIAATELFERDYLKEGTREQRRAMDVFRRRLVASLETDASAELNVEDHLAPDSAANWLAEHVSDLLSETPELQRAVVERFPSLFAVAFREIGLKADPKVRAVIMESMLRRLIVDTQSIAASLRDVASTQDAVRTTVDSFDMRLAKFMTTYDDGTQRLSQSLDAISRRLDALDVVCERSSNGAVRVSASILISDSAGVPLRLYEVREEHVTIGRSGTNAIMLMHGLVSARHCRLAFGSKVFVEDLESQNGTYIGELRIAGRQLLPADATVRVGPYQLRVTSPQSGAAVDTPSTIPAS